MRHPKRPTAFYNPHLLSREELMASFIARQPLLDLFVDDLRRGGGQHHLLIGSRGTGKTTLLLRLALAIDDDAKLAKKMIALRFPEEQYNVSRPSDLWLNCVDALVDSLEQRGDVAESQRLDAEIARVGAINDEDTRAREALELLTRWSKRAKKSVVLLIDNLDIILDRLPDHHWSLRKALGANQGLVLIGASSTYIQESFAYGSAFYEFFNVHELGSVSDNEARSMLLHLAKVTDTPQVAKAIEEHPGRLKALLRLSGGTPRTLGLLHGVLASETTISAEEDLEVILDQVTPYYKARFDDLPTQSQVIVDAVALHWHPITAAECAERTRLGVSLVSAQFSRLARQGFLEKVDAGEGKLTFQIGERFFNIWYLMRSSRRLSRTMFWLAASLQVVYGQEEIERRAVEVLSTEGNRDPARLLAFASLVAEERLRRRLEFCAIDVLVKGARRGAQLRDVLDLEGVDRHLVPVVDRATSLAEVRRRVLSSRVNWPSRITPQEVADLLCSMPIFTLATKLELAHQLELAPPDDGASSLIIVLRAATTPLPGMEISRLGKAIGSGEIPSLVEARHASELAAIMGIATDEYNEWWVVFALANCDVAVFGDDQPFADYLERSKLAPGFILGVVGARLKEIGWTTARRRVEQVLRGRSSFLIEFVSASETWKSYVKADRAGDIAELMERTGWSERALPMHLALRAVASGDLPQLAPEVHEPTQELLRQLKEPPVGLDDYLKLSAEITGQSVQAAPKRNTRRHRKSR